MTGTAPARGPAPADWVAAGLVLVAAVAFGLLRVQAVNLPWHLATARLAQTLGHWPARNTFSYTFPDYPAYQQYPVFQAALWTALQLGGWSALSVLSCAGWVAVLLLFVRWSGPWRLGATLHPFWMLALYALSRRMILRPDLFTMLALGGELVALDAYARGRRWALGAVPFVHLFWVNSHQLFPLSFVVQALFVAHLWGARRSSRPRDQAATPGWVAPALVLILSLALSLATPLGWRILETPARTARSLSLFRAQVAEFRPVWQMPLELGLALMTGIPAAFSLWRARRHPAPFDLGLWLLSLALLAAAVRGLMFFGVVSVAVAARAHARCRDAGQPLMPSLGPGPRRAVRAIGFALTTILAANVLYHRWVRPPLVLGGTQPGLGRSIGGWAEEATAFLRQSPPPGHMMNLGASVGDDVIFWVPGLPVFVDSRFESYPPQFLQEVLAADGSDANLAALIDRFDVQWIVAEHTREPLRARLVHLLRGGWGAVYVDSDYLVLVRDAAPNREYLSSHLTDLGRAEPANLVAAPLALRAEQRSRFARLMRALGQEGRVQQQREAAVAESGPDGVAAFADF